MKSPMQQEMERREDAAYPSVDDVREDRARKRRGLEAATAALNNIANCPPETSRSQMRDMAQDALARIAMALVGDAA